MDKKIELKEFDIMIASFLSKQKALKESLSESQIKVYHQHLQESKKKFLDFHKNPSEELLKLVEQYFQ